MNPADRSTGLAHFGASVDELAACASFEECAQGFCDRFYSSFSDTALVRIFGTVPYERLGEPERNFARAFATQIGAPATASGGDPVLTLFGTRGIEPDWSRRQASRGHLAIPLISPRFVSEIPMISRLFSELGFSQLETGNATWQFVSRRNPSDDGLFFVGDARTTTDERGRLIIPSSDFVERYRIRTVFGFGGPALSGSMLVSAIVFCRSVVSRADAERFVELVARLRSATARVLADQRLFAGGS